MNLNLNNTLLIDLTYSFTTCMDADCYLLHISCTCKATNGMSLTAFGYGSVKITVIDSRELTRTDIWGSGVEMICISIL